MEVIGDASLRSLVLAAIGLLLIPLLDARSAAARHAVWSLVLVGMLVLPVALLLMPPLPAPPLPIPAPSGGIPLQLIVIDSGTVASAPPVVKPPAIDWMAIVAAIYGIGVTLMLGRLVLGLWLRRRLLRRSTVIDTALLESSATTVPVTLGWISPKIILPIEWRSWEGWKLRAVLAHERAHVRRRDALIGLLASLNVSLYWFHPLAWWLRRRVAVLAEQASDDAAIRETGDARRYAEVVLE
ncbi:MAG: M56 family metallopeptidase, partial [bacterium]|nr:M56 family metallopeptidase [bacterium]